MAHRINRPARGLALALERLLGAGLGERESRVQGWTSVALAVVWLFQSFSRGASLDARVGEVTAQLEIGDKLDDKAGSLSRGQRQRLAIAQSISHKPRVHKNRLTSLMLRLRP